MSNSILFWAGIAILYLTIGYQIAKASLAVYDKWGWKEDDTFSTFIGLRLLLFPMNVLNGAETKDAYWLFIDSVRINHHEGAYTASHMIMWPIRIVGFGIAITMFYIIVPLGSLFGFVLLGTLRGSLSFFKGLFANSSPTTPAPTESKTAYFE